jgi:3-phenylpropionate/trans-cinnamate dioxygenase ferredoxin subunit
VGRHTVGPIAELLPGGRTFVEIGGRSIAVFNSKGNLFAVRNVCPHHGAPLCEGTVVGRMQRSEPHVYEYGEQGQVLRCPWHGYEFRLADGRAILDPDTMRVRTYRVEVEDDEVVVYV